MDGSDRDSSMRLLPKSPESRTTIVMFLGFLPAVCSFGFIRGFQMNEDLRNAAQGRSNKVSLIEDQFFLYRQKIVGPQPHSVAHTK